MTPDLVLYNGSVWTVDPTQPEATAVSISGNQILAVGFDREILADATLATRVVDLRGNMVLPGFVDAHTHFENAVKAFFDLRLSGVDDEQTLLDRLSERVEQVPEQFWITGGDWSANTGHRATRAGGSHSSFFPRLSAVDRITRDRPVLLRRYDGSFFLNSFGMKLFHINKSTPDPPGGEYLRDGSGELTGALLGTAGPRAAQMLPPKNRASTLVAARFLMHQLSRLGIVGIHDIARVPAISDRQIFQTNVERSFSDVTIFENLRAEGALAVRVRPVLTLRTWTELAESGIEPGSGDDLIRYNALKLFVGGFLMSRGFKNAPSFSGSLSFRNRDEAQLLEEMVEADAAGWDLAAHVTGDRGHALVMEGLEAASRINATRGRRHRVVHAWYPRQEEILRGGELGVFGDITPFHLIREMGSIEEKLHADQLPSAFAWRDMIEAGWRLNIVSDWPGSFDGSHDAPLDPLENIFMAITRHGPGENGQAFHPEQGLTVEEAIAGYTINPARASFEDDRRGSLTPGKSADLVVLSDDIRRIPTPELLRTEVVMTVFDGRIVFDLLS